VTERQEGKQFIAGQALAEHVRVCDMKHDVAVADHRTLRRPCRAGGVDKHREILGLRKPELAFPRLGIGSFVLGAALKQLVEGNDLIVAESE
jgi:hypothetical protein